MGQAFAQEQFSHWQVMESDPYEEGSPANLIVNDIRARKGLPPVIPRWQDYVNN